MSTLSTGIRSLDRRLGGGFHAGSLVTLVTPPAAQSHAILRELIDERPTVYLTTLRSATSVEGELDRSATNGTQLTVRAVGEAASRPSAKLQQFAGSAVYGVETSDRDSLLDDVSEIVEQIDGVANVIVDPANPLERVDSRSAYQELLRRLGTVLTDTGGLGLLHCPSMDDPPAFRETTLTVSDAVWELDVVSERRDRLDLHTRIPKNHRGNAILENVSLLVRDDSVGTDDSRSI